MREPQFLRDESGAVLLQFVQFIPSLCRQTAFHIEGLQAQRIRKTGVKMLGRHDGKLAGVRGYWAFLTRYRKREH